MVADAFPFGDDARSEPRQRPRRSSRFEGNVKASGRAIIAAESSCSAVPTMIETGVAEFAGTGVTVASVAVAPVMRYLVAPFVIC